MTRTALKHQVASGLRTLRERAGISREDAASVIRASVPTIGHIETARSLPSGLQLEKLLAHYGCPERIPAFLDLRERARAGHDWWSVHPADAIPAYRTLFLGGETVAERIEVWDPQHVPELARTPDYAAALLRATDTPPEDLDQRLALLADRQRAVLDDNAPAVTLVIGEVALRWPVGEPAVVRAQVDHLVALTRRPTVEVRILPVEAPRHPGPFTLLTFPGLGLGDEPTAVYEETMVSGYHYDSPVDVARYRAAFAGLVAESIGPDGLPVMLRRLGF